jgi:hypothetical protein
MRRVRPLAAAVLGSCALLGVLAPFGPATRGSEPEPAPAPALAWLDDPGTAVLGFGVLRAAPERPGAGGTVRIRYEEKPGDYGAFDAVQVIVLPIDAFARSGRATAGEVRAFSRSGPSGGAYASKAGAAGYETRASFSVTTPSLFVVGFGPFVGPDTGRPLTLARPYTIEVTGEGATWRWVDAEAGELNVKGWTNRPEVVSRGEPVKDPATGASHWFEVRPLVVFDKERVRAPNEADAPEVLALRTEADALDARAAALDAQGKPDVAKEVRAEAEGLRRAASVEDARLPLPSALVEKFRLLPFRWK